MHYSIVLKILRKILKMSIIILLKVYEHISTMVKIHVKNL